MCLLYMYMLSRQKNGMKGRRSKRETVEHGGRTKETFLAARRRHRKQHTERK